MRSLILPFTLLLFLSSCQSSTPSLHLYVGNLSRGQKQSDVKVFFDNVSIFDSSVTFSADQPYREFISGKNFTKGNHTIYVTADSGNLKMTQPVTTKEDMWVFVTYTRGSGTDSLLEQSVVKKTPWLSSIAVARTNPSVHIFISGTKPTIPPADAAYKQWATDTSFIY